MNENKMEQFSVYVCNFSAEDGRIKLSKVITAAFMYTYGTKSSIWDRTITLKDIKGL